MKKNRSIKELLNLTLIEGNKNFKKGIPDNDFYKNGYIGLCGFVSSLISNRDQSHSINNREVDTIIKFIENNRPKENSPLCTKNHNNGSPYYWPKGQWAPRKRWLEYHIKSL